MVELGKSRALGASEPWSPGLAIGLAVLALVVLLDLALDSESAAMVGSYVAPPFVTALIAGPRATVIVGTLAIALAVVSPMWNMNTGGDVHTVAHVALVGAGSAFAFASSLASARARGRTDRLTLLDSVGDVADGSLPLAETLNRLVDALVPAIGDICMVDAVHDGRVRRIATRVSGHPDAAEFEAGLRERPPSAPSWLVDIVRPWRAIPRWIPKMGDEDIRRLSHGSEDLRFLRTLGIRSSISVPIAARDRNLGVLTLVMAWSGRSYDADDVRFAQIVASRVALALDNAGLFSDLESVERRMDSVMSILDEAVVIHGAGGELIFANPAAARMLGFESSEEALTGPIEKIGERLSIRDETGAEVGPEALAGRPLLAGAGAASMTLRTVDRRSGRERWCRTKSRAIRGPQGEMLYSVTAIDDVSDVKRAEFSARLLARVGELVSHSADYRRTLHEVPGLIVPEFADGCSVNIVRADGFVEQVNFAHPDPEQARAVSEARRKRPIRLDDMSSMARVIRSGEPLLIQGEAELAEALAEEPERLEAFRGAGVTSAIFTPMGLASGGVGALKFINQRGSRIFDHDDLELAVELARRVGLALESARLAEERAVVADALQRELLPPIVPEMPGWDVATMYEPAGEVNEVGGDFYEVFAVEGGWAIVLGDVSGKGAAAASLTAEARHTIRTAGAIAGDPRAGLRLLDQNLRNRADAALCSVAIVVVPERAEDGAEAFVYLAGHPHPLLLSRGEATPVGDPGPLLGIVADAHWRAVRVPLSRGDQLVLYTDGVIEARAEGGERFGAERLQARLRGCTEPDAAVARVRSALEQFGALARQDDAALVAVRCSGARPAPSVVDASLAASTTSAAS